jgi:hypothetical protein
MGLIGSPCTLGAKQYASPYTVSSMPLKGTVRRKQASEKWCLVKRYYGESKRSGFQPTGNAAPVPPCLMG